MGRDTGGDWKGWGLVLRDPLSAPPPQVRPLVGQVYMQVCLSTHKKQTWTITKMLRVVVPGSGIMGDFKLFCAFPVLLVPYYFNKYALRKIKVKPKKKINRNRKT